MRESFNGNTKPLIAYVMCAVSVTMQEEAK